MKSLKGKVAVITGAASGIGRELSIQLAGLGANVAISDINEEGLKETSCMVKSAGGNVKYYVLDVSDRGRVYKFADHVIKDHRHIDILINNAGVSLHGNVEDLTYENLEWIIGINMWGVVYVTKAFLPHLKKRPEANIVNVSSVFGLVAVAGRSAYSMSKFAVRGFTEALRQEYHGTGVHVTCVHPGGIKTNIIKNCRFNDRNQIVDIKEIEKKFLDASKTTAQHAAKIMIKGIVKRKPRILIGSDAKKISILARLMPARYDQIVINSIVKKIKI